MLCDDQPLALSSNGQMALACGVRRRENQIPDGSLFMRDCFSITTIPLKPLTPPRSLLYPLASMANSLQSMMSGLALGDPSSPTPAPRKQSTNPSNPPTQGNRLPAVMRKYMNPNLARPPNTGLTSSQHVNQDTHRSALLTLAGLNVPSPGRPSKGYSVASPKGKVSLTQHTAKGLHGPAHSTTTRVLSSTTHGVVASGNSQHVLGKKVDIGVYDGGFEVDDGREVVTGESARILALDSSAGSSCVSLIPNPALLWSITLHIKLESHLYLNVYLDAEFSLDPA